MDAGHRRYRRRIQKQCVEVSEACDTCVDGLRKYDEDMHDFANSGIGADI